MDRGLHIFDHDIAERNDLQEVSDDTNFRFTSTPGRGGKALLAVESVIKPLWASPLTGSSRPSHDSSRLHRVFDMTRSFHHQVQDRLPTANDAVAFKLGTWVNTNSQRLIIGFLCVAELHVEQAQLVPLGARLATFEQVARFGGSTGHQ